MPCVQALPNAEQTGRLQHFAVCLPCKLESMIRCPCVSRHGLAAAISQDPGQCLEHRETLSVCGVARWLVGNTQFLSWAEHCGLQKQFPSSDSVKAELFSSKQLSSLSFTELHWQTMSRKGRHQATGGRLLCLIVDLRSVSS